MHRLVRRFIKTAIAFLAFGLGLGVYMIVARELFGAYLSPYMVSAHAHALLAGFVMLMIMGVALWLFPRPGRDDHGYSPRLAEASYWVVTVATAARVVGELLRPFIGAWWLRVTVVAAGLGQVAGLALFFLTMWPRIRAAGSREREARGERF